MGFLKALALFVSSYIANRDDTIEALMNIGKTVTITGNTEIKIEKEIVEREVLKKFPDNQLAKMESEFKKYKNHPNAVQLGMTVSFLKKGSSKTETETLKGVKGIESFIKKAKDEKYIVL